MSPPKLKNFLGLASLIILAPVVFFTGLFLTHNTPHTVIVMSILPSLAINILLVAVFSCLGNGAGYAVLAMTVIGFHFLYIRCCLSAEAYFILSLFVSGIFGRKFSYDFYYLAQRGKLDIEKIDERINVLRDEVEKNTNEISHLEKRLQRYLDLNRITEAFCSTFSEDEMARIVVENAYGFLTKSERVLLFKVDTSNQELRLVYSKRVGDVPAVRFKKGDMFDRWVFWKKQPLLVEDTRKDFRFSLDEKAENVFNSVISCPLVSGEKVLGILRVDSRNTGTYTPEDLRVLDIISDIAAVALENCYLYKRLNDIAITDGLTFLYVNKYFKEMLVKEANRSLKSGTPFSLVMFDVDGFKGYNDRYGHIAGDIVLKHISGILSRSLAGGDIAARYGGEEFAVLLPGKDKKDALKFAEGLRKNIANTPVILRREKTRITISVGIAMFPNDSKLADDVLRAADKRLYKAKEKGKNRTCVF